MKDALERAGVKRPAAKEPPTPDWTPHPDALKLTPSQREGWQALRNEYSLVLTLAVLGNVDELVKHSYYMDSWGRTRKGVRSPLFYMEAYKRRLMERAIEEMNLALHMLDTEFPQETYPCADN